MKPAWIFLILPLLIACRANQSIAPTITPLAETSAPLPTRTQASALPAQSTPEVSPAAPRSFPNAENYTWRQIIGGLSRPVDLQPAQGKIFILEKIGRIRVFENGQLLPAPFLDITDRVDESGNEMGLLGLAFHPNFESNGFYYVNYTGAGGHTRISRFTGSDPNSEKVLLTIEQPYSNHNGGVLAFGADGYLYAGLGDGGLAGDPHKHGQNTTSLLGKILRVDVNNGDPYAIPADNPFATEVWAYGLRNPWRMSFDQKTGDLWIADVGQGAWEEVNYFPANGAPGANFGWSVMEGNHGYNGEPQPGLILPAVEYSHDTGGCSVTGGYVYRGAMTEWDGIYLYGDYCLGTIWGLMLVDGNWQNAALFQTGELLTTFGQDQTGELYFASDQGAVYQLTKK